MERIHQKLVRERIELAGLNKIRKDVRQDIKKYEEAIKKIIKDSWSTKSKKRNQQGLILLLKCAK